MTNTQKAPNGTMDDSDEPTAAEIEAAQREDFFPPADEAADDAHPCLYNISVAISDGRPHARDGRTGRAVKHAVGGRAVRRRFFDVDELPAPMAKIAELGDVNVILVPRTRSRYHEYAPLYHLLGTATLDGFGPRLLRWRRPQPGRDYRAPLTDRGRTSS